MRIQWVVLSIGLASASGAQQAAVARYDIGAIAATEVPSSLALFDAMDVAVKLIAPRVAKIDSGPALIANIQRRTNWLRGRWQAAKANPTSDPIGFRQTFAYDVAVLRAAATDDDIRRVAAVLRDVNDDVNEKADHCAKSPAGMATPVKVSVRTWNGKTESPNWQILYMPKIMEFSTDASGATMPFKVFSSPSVEELAPGRYIVWARRPGQNGVVGERTTIRVGGGAATMAQDIPVPP